jgi:hypothetical protein
MKIKEIIAFIKNHKWLKMTCIFIVPALAETVCFLLLGLISLFYDKLILNSFGAGTFCTIIYYVTFILLKDFVFVDKIEKE